MTENKAELVPYMKKAEEIYSLMKNLANMFPKPPGCDASILGDNTYKDVVTEHMAVVLKTEHLSGFDEGTKKAMKNEADRLMILNETYDT